MNEKQFQTLTEECDVLLTEASHSLCRVSISWLHVIREHPIFLKHYEKIFDAPIIGTRYQWLGIKRSLVEFVRTLRQLARGVKATLISCFKGRYQPTQADIIIVSHLLNTQQMSIDSDIYFGDLPEILINNGYKVTQILIDQTNHSSNATYQLLQSNVGLKRVVLPNSLGFWAELKMLFGLLRESSMLLPKVRDDSIKSRIRIAAAAEALSSASSNAMRIGLQVSHIAKQSKAKLVMTTFEGHAWERAVFLQTRKHSPATRRAGYQHSTLFRLQHGLKRFVSGACDPDIVFTSGELALQALSISLKGTNQVITNLGSLRAGNRLTLSAEETAAKEQQPSCLVIPEGLDYETAFMFKFSLNCALRLPHIRFIWRLHPVLPFSSLLKKYTFLAKLPPNIILSSSSLEEDAKQAKWVLYRGSSAVISSVMAGSGPIYVSLSGEMTLDPLFSEPQHPVIQTEDEFIQLVKETDYPSNDQIPGIIEYCNGVFSTLRPEVLLTCLSEMKDENGRE
ncbi:hypothetical protein [Methylophilus sp. TWE2]|uniref:hypothetical protein n=1 Tax=Methylophilus sp. TWE2 TaxID=1662285 RepID=UPI0006711C52|nr:hypothetical protein [Methylophilus sp. TWE2]AKR43481.1 hypothetical protein ACJ67_08630 [Methylophilus sp. TWE2]